MTSGRKYWANGTPVAGQQFDYTFDSIGNRQTAASGGNQFGSGLRQQNYSANNLNQYTSRTVPPYVDVLGTATNNATVTVWADKALPILSTDPAGLFRTLRQGDYWRAEVPVNNSTGALWLTLTNYAVLQQGTNADILSAVTGSVLVAKSPEAFTYDLDGNLTSDSLWTNTWNGENRRVTVENSAGVSPAAARAREQWTFLPDGRWIERIVSTNNGSAYTTAYTNRYIWNGNVLLAVLDHTNGLCQSFTRGLDLSGTPQGAGGAGGLLWVWDRSTINSQPSTHAACYDGNGNVMALVNLSDGITSAEYAYGPFAEPLQATGPMAKANPLRFSTQYADDVTGDVNYLFRFYTARSGRWLSRDPLTRGSRGNLVRFCSNRPTDAIDQFGLFDQNDFVIEHKRTVDPRELDPDAMNVEFHKDYKRFRIKYPANGRNCQCRGRDLGSVSLSWWIDVDRNNSLKDADPAFYSELEKWPPLSLPGSGKAQLESPDYVGAGIEMYWWQNKAARVCCKNPKWKQEIMGRVWNTQDGPIISGHWFVDSPGGKYTKFLKTEFSNSYKLELFCDADEDFKRQTLQTWAWGVSINLQPFEWSVSLWLPSTDFVETLF